MFLCAVTNALPAVISSFKENFTLMYDKIVVYKYHSNGLNSITDILQVTLLLKGSCNYTVNFILI